MAAAEPPVVRCWDATLRPAALPALEAEARALWAAMGGDRAYARTNWIPASAKPRCALERLALDFMRFYFPSPAARRAVAGCEFWTQLRDSGRELAQQGLSLHFDKDERAVEAWDIWAHPEIGTATYLTAGGAPLVVFATRSREDGSSSEEGGEEAPSAAPGPAPSRAAVCFPRPGRHVAFDGRLLHGVPEELLTLGVAGQPAARRGGGPARLPRGAAYTSRLAFLVNIWTSHRPEGVRQLPKALAARMSGASRTAGGASASRSALALTPKKKQVPPWRRVVAAPPPGRRVVPGRMVPGTSLYALREHLRGDTGLLPAPSVVRARGGAAGGLLDVVYRPPAAVRKRPAAAPAAAKRRRR